MAVSHSSTEIAALCQAVRSAIKSVIVLDDDRIIDHLLVALALDGHILLDDVPGVGKTLLARTFAAALGLDFKRIQFTPDLLPSDVSGLNYYNQKTGEFEFRPGPVFTKVLLADEINRATPRTQASLLECMQEGNVTVDGVTHALQRPFLVIATQNPIDMEGTFPLPEAQLDRFLLCLKMGYPNHDSERAIALRFLTDDPLMRVTPVVTPHDLSNLKRAVHNTHFALPVLDYAVSVARVTRDMDHIRLGASPRGTLALCRAAQALAAVRGRRFVLPDDVQDMVIPVLAHRLIPEIDAALYAESTTRLLGHALERIPVPIGEFEP